MVDDKKKKEEKKKGMEAMDGMTKTSIKDMKTKPDGCEPEEEEKPDLRSKYAMINLIKNKLRAAGQRNPMVMMNDPVMGEENVSEDMPPRPMTSVTGDGSKLSPKHLPGGPNSQYDIDGVPKKKKPTGPSKPSGEIKKDTAPKTRKPKYNPYGPGTANPENMAPGKP